METGLVEVRKGGKVWRVRAHEKLVASANGEPVMGPNQDHLYDYYRTHVFECNGTPLWRLVEKLNEVYPVHIVIRNESLGNKQVTTSFVDRSPEEILDIIRVTFPGSRVEHPSEKEYILK
ncbi:FecR domain-containing protein [Puia sp. P3]|uniref:FecR domain-containing protein n=1 Tax=Puia sp. P3 TaxID=3423952 RepID=UPI003D673561